MKEVDFLRLLIPCYDDDKNKLDMDLLLEKVTAYMKKESTTEPGRAS